MGYSSVRKRRLLKHDAAHTACAPHGLVGLGGIAEIVSTDTVRIPRDTHGSVGCTGCIARKFELHECKGIHASSYSKILSISFQRGRGTRLTRKRFGDDIARHNGSQVGEEIPKLLLGDAIRQIAEKDRAAVVILVQGSLRCAWGGNRIRRLALDFGSWNNAELLVVAHELCTVSK